ncbi:MAG: hypothetical protein KKD39_04090 [Candidatus Altiarchaeota archaeon]|nr:hypothetical protein [Candidatus Altiarchaeota archaeon]
MRLHTILCVLAVLLILGCNKPEQYVDCERILDKNERYECRYNLTIGKLEAAKCKEIGNTNLSRKCVNEIAVKLKNEYPCYQHARASDKDECEKLVANAQKQTV